jgi:hypothetical protein
VHEEVIQQILDSLKLPEEIAIVHVPGHQKGVNFEAWGNSFADKTVKQAALIPKVPVFCPIPHLPAPPVTPIFIPPKEEQLNKIIWVNQDQTGKMSSSQ